MLKIKDNVDLNIFKEKYNATFRYSEFDGELTEITLNTTQNEHLIFKKIIKPKKTFSFIRMWDKFVINDWYAMGYIIFREDMMDLLYDLIKADLVEKMEE